MPTYLDENGEPIGAAPRSSGPVYLNDNGEPNAPARAPQDPAFSDVISGGSNSVPTPWEPNDMRFATVPSFTPGVPSVNLADFDPSTTAGKIRLGAAAAAGGVGLAAAAPAMAAAAGPVIASPIARGLATTIGLKGIEKVTGVNIPWWLKTAAEVASGGSAIKLGGRTLGRAAMGALLKGSFGEAEAATPAAAEAIAPAAAQAAAQAAAEVAPAASKVVASTVGLAKDKVWTVMDRAGQALRVFTNPHEAAQFAATAKNVASVVKTAAPAVTEAVEAAPTVAKAVQTVAQAAPKAGGNFAALQRFAKEAAMRGTKLGEKIWLELDQAGNPIRLLENSDKAGALKRAGGNTTWVKNIWS